MLLYLSCYGNESSWHHCGLKTIYNDSICWAVPENWLYGKQFEVLFGLPFVRFQIRGVGLHAQTRSSRERERQTESVWVSEWESERARPPARCHLSWGRTLSQARPVLKRWLLTARFHFIFIELLKRLPYKALRSSSRPRPPSQDSSSAWCWSCS